MICLKRQLIMSDSEKKYWILFIDDYICFSYVTLLKIKDEVFSAFKHFLSFHEQSDHLCHCLHMNESGKYKFKKLVNFCLNKSIALELISIQQHQSNDLVKIWNWIICDKLNLMCLAVKLDYKYWSHVTKMVNYLWNWFINHGEKTAFWVMIWLQVRFKSHVIFWHFLLCAPDWTCTQAWDKDCDCNVSWISWSEHINIQGTHQEQKNCHVTECLFSQWE